MGASLMNESAAKMDVKWTASLFLKAMTHTGLADRVPPVSEVVPEPGLLTVTGGPSFTELEITGESYTAKELAGMASSCSGDGDPDLNEPQPLDFVPNIANVQVENAGGCRQQNAAALQDHAVDAIGSVDTTDSDPVRDKSLTGAEVRGN